jgi:hypothetical protein
MTKTLLAGSTDSLQTAAGISSADVSSSGLSNAVLNGVKGADQFPLDPWIINLVVGQCKYVNFSVYANTS